MCGSKLSPISIWSWINDNEARRTFEMVAGQRLPPLAEKRETFAFNPITRFL